MDLFVTESASCRQIVSFSSFAKQKKKKHRRGKRTRTQNGTAGSTTLWRQRFHHHHVLYWPGRQKPRPLMELWIILRGCRGTESEA